MAREVLGVKLPTLGIVVKGAQRQTAGMAGRVKGQERKKMCCLGRRRPCSGGNYPSSCAENW